MNDQEAIEIIENVIMAYFEDSLNNNKSGDYDEEIESVVAAWNRISKSVVAG